MARAKECYEQNLHSQERLLAHVFALTTIDKFYLMHNQNFCSQAAAIAAAAAALLQFVLFDVRRGVGGSEFDPQLELCDPRFIYRIAFVDERQRDDVPKHEQQRS